MQESDKVDVCVCNVWNLRRHIQQDLSRSNAAQAQYPHGSTRDIVHVDTASALQISGAAIDGPTPAAHTADRGSV